MCRKLYLAAAAFACLSASPAAAADPNQFFHEQSERARIGGYFGATISFARTAHREHGPRLRLGIGARHWGGPTTPALAGAPFHSIAELDFSAKRQPNLYLGGRRLSAAEGGSGWGTGETLLVIAGVAVAVLLATQLGGSDDDDDDRCRIEPWLCE